MLNAVARRHPGLLPLLLFGFCTTLVIQAVRPMASYRALQLGADAFELGVIASAFAVFSLTLAIPLGSRVDRWGEPRMLVIGSFVLLLSAVSLIIIDAVWALAASQAILGLGQIMTVIGCQSLLARIGDPSRRDNRYGIFTITVSLGQFIAPAGAGLVAGGGVLGASHSADVDTHRVFLVAGVLSAIAVAVGFVILLRSRSEAAHAPATPDPAKPKTSFASVREVMSIRGMPRAMIVSMTVLTSIDILTAYLPAYAEENGISVQVVGFLLATRAAASMASRIGMIAMMRRLGRRNLLLLSVLAGGLAFAAFPFVPLPGQYVAMVIVGFGLGLGQPVTLSWVAGRSPRRLRGTAFGVRLSGNRFGQVVIPAVVGVLATTLGIGSVFGVLAVILSGSAVALLGTSFELPEDPDA